ncbi:dead end protein 1-like [Astyanax mexicanus]|uniref:Dead end protein 1-like n=1 Tax=Astyanax mexicanus TaxID=7994 RepID=A0A8B9LXE3_ASTMX|nr:dead end protein 1-like [Astyanax mexicanus]
MEGVVVQVLNPLRVRALEEWLKTTSITLTQINGQRKYGGPPPDWRGPHPGPGCEVFISQIPRDVYEDQLIPLFLSVAPLYEFRLMMNFSGQNRGFAYAKYGTPAGATAAIQTLNHYQLQEGVRLVVRKSTEKRQLWLADLPASMGRGELLMVLRMLSDGVEGATIKAAGPKGKEVCALVHYSSHYAASMAKKVLVQGFKKQLGICISVRWMTSGSKSRQEEHLDQNPLNPPGLKPPVKPSPLPPRFQINRPTQLSNYLDPLPPPSLRPPPPPSLSPLNALLSPPPQYKQQFPQAVGSPGPQVRNGMAPVTAVRPPLSSHDAVSQLKWLCELYGIGVPLYDVRYHHTGPDGFLHFNYRVIIPQLPIPLCGSVQVLPGPSISSMEEEVQRATAEQVIKTMCQQS